MYDVEMRKMFVIVVLCAVLPAALPTWAGTHSSPTEPRDNVTSELYRRWGPLALNNTFAQVSDAVRTNVTTDILSSELQEPSDDVPVSMFLLLILVNKLNDGLNFSSHE